jgi:hypothetical protein
VKVKARGKNDGEVKWKAKDERAKERCTRMRWSAKKKVSAMEKAKAKSEDKVGKVYESDGRKVVSERVREANGGEVSESKWRRGQGRAWGRRRKRCTRERTNV